MSFGRYSQPSEPPDISRKGNETRTPGNEGGEVRRIEYSRPKRNESLLGYIHSVQRGREAIVQKDVEDPGVGFVVAHLTLVGDIDELNKVSMDIKTFVVYKANQLSPSFYS